MTEVARRLWAEQDRHRGDRWRLYQTIGRAIDARTVLYPGSFVDIAPSFVFASVTYVDTDDRAASFFADRNGIDAIVSMHDGAPTDREMKFIHADYTGDLGLPAESFDLLVSLYAGFVSEWCTQYLRVGGTLLVNPSHGDTAMASIDDRYRLIGVVKARDGQYRATSTQLDTHLVPKQPVDITREYLHDRGRGIPYTTAPFAYLFERVR